MASFDYGGLISKEIMTFRKRNLICAHATLSTVYVVSLVQNLTYWCGSVNNSRIKSCEDEAHFTPVGYFLRSSSARTKIKLSRWSNV